MIVALGYPGIVFVMFLENVFPPIPSEVVLPLVGFLAARGEFNFWWALAASVLGSVLGAIALYGFGAWAGDRVLQSFIQRRGKWFGLSEEKYERAMIVFGDHRRAAVFVGRLMPMIRSLISIPAGIKRMPFALFLLLTTLGTTLWNLLLGGAGWWLGSRWQLVLEWTRQYETGIWLALAVLVLIVFLTHWLRRSAPRSAEDA